MTDPRETPEPAGKERTEVVRSLWRGFVTDDTTELDGNFFALGGDSLAAARLVARVNDRLGGAVELSDFFATPTLRTLLAGSPAGTRWVAAGVADATRLSAAQRRLWLQDRLFPGSAEFTVSCSLDLRRPVDLGELRERWSRLVATHDQLRLRIREDDSEPVADRWPVEAFAAGGENRCAGGRRGVPRPAVRAVLRPGRRAAGLARGELLRFRR